MRRICRSPISRLVALTLATLCCNVYAYGTPQDFLAAAISGDKDAVELMLDKGFDVNSRGFVGSTALHQAAFHGRQGVAEVLLAHGANVNAKDDGGTTPLHHALDQRHKDLAKLLLAHGADANSKDNLGETPFQMAADRAYRCVGQTPGSYGCIKGDEDMDIVELMVPKDQAALANLARDDKNGNVREIAVRRLIDQTLLAKVAIEDTEENVRYAAAGRIQDGEVLGKIASTSLNSGTRMQVVVVLRRLLEESGALKEPVWVWLHVTGRGKNYSFFPYGTYAPINTLIGEVVEVSLVGPGEAALAHRSWIANMPTSVGAEVSFVKANLKPPDMIDLVVDLCGTGHCTPLGVRQALTNIALKDKEPTVRQAARNKLSALRK